MFVHMRAIACVHAAIRVKKMRRSLYSKSNCPYRFVEPKRDPPSWCNSTSGHFVSRHVCPSVNRTKTSWLILINFVFFFHVCYMLCHFVFLFPLFHVKDHFLWRSTQSKKFQQPATHMTFRVLRRGELSYLALLGSEKISAPYFKQCFSWGGYYPPRLSQTPRLPVPRQK